MFSDAAEESEKVFYEGSIDPKWITRRMMSNIAGSGCCLVILIAFSLFPLLMSFGSPFESLFGMGSILENPFTLVVLGLIGLIVLIFLYRYFWAKAHVRNFSYQITGTHIIIQRGVFSKRRDSIPFSRIQNISVTSGFFDRMFGLSNVQIETAGGSGMVYPMGKRGRAAMSAEGFIPGQTNPQFIESKIREMVKKHDSGGGGT
jgi:uncharacterized membrane protein YdbT with pleckstrin-like domain